METTTYELLREGKEWQSYDEGFKACLREYERQSGYTTKIIKKDKKQAKVKCFIGTCSFSLNLNCRKKDNVWYISHKSSEFGHKCDIMNHPAPVAPPAQIIALVSEEFKMSNKLPSWGDMKAKAQASNLKVTKKVAYTARNVLKHNAWGAEEKEFFCRCLRHFFFLGAEGIYLLGVMGIFHFSGGVGIFLFLF